MELHVIDASELPEQVSLLRQAPDVALFQPVRNARHPRKPAGGLWTSSYLGVEDISAWWLWASAAMPDKVSDHADFTITPGEGLRVIVVDSVEDGGALFEAYGSFPSPGRYPWETKLDYEAMAADGYGGLHLTQRGLALHQGQDGTSVDLVCFDCECTLWLVWPSPARGYVAG